MVHVCWHDAVSMCIQTGPQSTYYPAPNDWPGGLSCLPLPYSTTKQKGCDWFSSSSVMGVLVFESVGSWESWNSFTLPNNTAIKGSKTIPAFQHEGGGREREGGGRVKEAVEGVTTHANKESFLLGRSLLLFMKTCTRTHTRADNIFFHLI